MEKKDDHSTEQALPEFVGFDPNMTLTINRCDFFGAHPFRYSPDGKLLGIDMTGYTCYAPGHPHNISNGRFRVGQLVRKIKGSNWQGKIVGTYSTELTPEGYAVESSTEHGSVQIYPAAALELVPQKSLVILGFGQSNGPLFAPEDFADEPPQTH